MTNSIFTIRPYKKGSVWVFSEPSLGIFEEPFVGGVNQIIDAMLRRAKLPEGEPFTALFSANKFPGAETQLMRMEEEAGGYWYGDITLYRGDYVAEVSRPMGGWLCPVLFKFFCEAPKNIYCRAEK